MHKKLITMLAMTVTATATFAMSPYCNNLAIQSERHTGEIAFLKAGITVEQATQVLKANAAAIKKACKAGANADNITVCAKRVNEKNVIFVHRFDPKGNDPKVITWPKAVLDLLEPHPLAARRSDGEKVWLDMELICHLPCAADKKPTGPITRAALVTGLKPEKEEMYRTLHQTVWPGIIDQIRRSNTRHWTTWCVDINEKTYLIAYCEYIGSDPEADNKAMAADPLTKRWLKLTDACQAPLPGVKGTWAGMDELLHIK